MKHLFVINPHSFRGHGAVDRVIDTIKVCFQGRDDDYHFHLSRYPRDAIGFIRNFKDGMGSDEVLRVYAVGGNGILFDCLNGIMGLTNMELAMVPYGISQDMVRAFGDNKAPLFRNIRAQIAAGPIPTDVMSCGSSFAINFCAIGLEARLIKMSLDRYSRTTRFFSRFSHIDAMIYGFLFYIEGLKAIFDPILRNQYYTVTIDGEDMSGHYGSINIANGACYGRNKNPVITAVPDDGLFDIVFFPSRDPLKSLRLVPPYISGKYQQFPGEFIWKRGRRIHIHSDNPLLISLDGEAFYDTGLNVELIPLGVRIAAPEESRYEQRVQWHEMG